MKKCVFFLVFIASLNAHTQNPLFIPPALTGTSFQLNVQAGTKVFYNGISTRTYGINGAFLSPTLIINKGDSINLTVNNGLAVPTTMHWHGLHVAAHNDGGTNRVIARGASWSPSFVVRNQAGTNWYHPHGDGQTDPQVSKGLAGMIIVHDSTERTLNLPQTYGVDDIPLIVQTKAFDVLGQIAISTEMDTAIFINGTPDAYLDAPAQVVRFRIVNSSSMRSYNFGLSNNQTFYQIATEGGLKTAPLPLTRLRLSPGERAEILIDFQGMLGQSIYLMSYAATMLHGIYGSATVGAGIDTIAGYNQNRLNGADYNLLKINVISPTARPITSIPSALIPYLPYLKDSATVTRYLVLDTFRRLPLDRPNLAEGPFGINNRSYSMDSVEITTRLDATEIWVLINKTNIAHPFHIHDVQYNVIEKGGVAPIPAETGWKDVVLVMPHDSVKFITRFETFADATQPYMYHCHLLHHEDDGMMGNFIVMPATTNSINEAGADHIHWIVAPNPIQQDLQLRYGGEDKSMSIAIKDMAGRELYTIAQLRSNTTYTLSTDGMAAGLYLVTLMRDGQVVEVKKIVKE